MVEATSASVAALYVLPDSVDGLLELPVNETNAVLSPIQDHLVAQTTKEALISRGFYPMLITDKLVF